MPKAVAVLVRDHVRSRDISVRQTSRGLRTRTWPGTVRRPPAGDDM